MCRTNENIVNGVNGGGGTHTTALKAAEEP